ncbi:hypothetical protein N0V93_007189 [Gnomoniopsis smithogilvyi]|uniref:Uncharacterized protein n=1 Tax=Gnomoniopsis smithogilvyi TaxID=1191159 RepID=A0A9W8YR41_9PEZI|nr:hypothetical protein N0V93_007189 [Gnomoniopsis smithogilvyi]
MPSRGSSSKQWQRLKPVELDLLESIGLPSKGDSRLLDHKTQERFYTKIVERYLSFCSDVGDRDALLQQFASLATRKQQGVSSRTDPSTPDAATAMASSAAPAKFPTPAPQTKDLSTVLMALRKLREGLVASKRVDDFATQTYLFNIRTAVLVKHVESYHPAILYLLHTIHPNHPLTSFELREITGYLVLDAACRRNDLAEAFLLRHRFKLRDPKIDAILRALVRDDFLSFVRIKRSVDGHKAIFLEFYDDTMKRHTLKCFGRAYLAVDTEYLERATGSTFAKLVEKEGVGWHSDGSKVVIRSIKGRSG